MIERTLKIISWLCAALWVYFALVFLALNYWAFVRFIGGTLIALIPFMLWLGKLAWDKAANYYVIEKPEQLKGEE